jgi:CRP/FNR family transcriptional regulator
MPSPCSLCNLRGACLPRLIGKEHDMHLERLVYARRRVGTGEALFHAGDVFNSVYAVFNGSFKARAIDRQARGQVTGFFMQGELLGLDAIGSGRHHLTALALEDSAVCAMPYRLIEEIGRELPALQRGLHAALAQEIVREQGMMLVLGAMRAEERVAAFLLNLSLRFRRLGYSGREYRLRMTREDIGSYLGMTTETVSRLFTNLRHAGILAVQQRRLRVLDPARLESLAHGLRLPEGAYVFEGLRAARPGLHG